MGDGVDPRTRRCINLIQLVATVILVLLGIAGMIVWLWEEVARPEIYLANSFIDNIMYGQARYILMLAYSVTLFVVLLIQLCMNVEAEGTDDPSSARRLVWTITSLLLILTFVTSAALGYSYKNDQLPDLATDMTAAIQADFFNGTGYTSAGENLNKAQSMLGCCGVNGGDDYTGSPYQVSTGEPFPYSCCVLQSSDLKGKTDIESTDVLNWTLCQAGYADYKYNGGCYEDVYDACASLCDELTIIGFVAAGIVFIAACARLASEYYYENRKKRHIDQLVHAHAVKTVNNGNAGQAYAMNDLNREKTSSNDASDRDQIEAVTLSALEKEDTKVEDV